MKRIIAAVILSAALAPTPSYASLGFGRIDCGKWINWRKQDQAMLAEIWLLGFLTGMNVTGGSIGLDPLKGRNPEQFYTWMDNYCQKNPLENTYKGGMTLYMELKTLAKGEE